MVILCRLGFLGIGGSCFVKIKFMKRFVFELAITEQDIEGDEFWEQALKKDGTGITALKEAIAQAIEDSNLMICSDRKPIEIIALRKYEKCTID